MYRRHRAGRDPCWLTTKYDDTCRSCGAPVSRGTRTFYYPSAKAVHCPACSEHHAADFRSHAEDEPAYGRSCPTPAQEAYAQGDPDLYAQALRRFGQVSTLIEWDDHIPPFAAVHAEALHAKAIYEATRNALPDTRPDATDLLEADHRA
jgi:hypothetical protein